MQVVGTGLKIWERTYTCEMAVEGLGDGGEIKREIS